jgi:hypothetical protein
MMNKMSNNNIVTPNNIDYEKITMGDKITLGSGASFVNIKYNSGTNLLLQLPKATSFGVDAFEDTKTGDKKYTMSIQFKKENIELDEKVKNAVDGLKEFETYIKDWAQKNSQEIFKKKVISKDYIDATFNPILKESKNKETEEPDGRYFTLKIKLKPSKKAEDKFDFGGFHSNKEKMNITKENVTDIIKKWGEVKTVITPNIWIISGKLGISWSLWQLKYWEPEGGFMLNKEDFCMIESSEEEEEEEEEDEEEHEVVVSDSD